VTAVWLNASAWLVFFKEFPSGRISLSVTQARRRDNEEETLGICCSGCRLLIARTVSADFSLVRALPPLAETAGDESGNPMGQVARA
jgi:hypothetical protein